MYAIKGFDLFPEETNIWEIRNLEDDSLVMEFSVPMSYTTAEQVLAAWLEYSEHAR